MRFSEEQFENLLMRASALDAKLNSCDTTGSEGYVLCQGREPGNGRDYRPQITVVSDYYSELLNNAASIGDAIDAVARGIAQTEWIALVEAGYEPFFNYIRRPEWAMFGSPAGVLFEAQEFPFQSPDPGAGARAIFQGISENAATYIGYPEVGDVGADRLLKFGLPAPEGFELRGLSTIFPQASEIELIKLEKLLFKAATLTLNNGKPIGLYKGLLALEQVFGDDMSIVRARSEIQDLEENIEKQYAEILAKEATDRAARRNAIINAGKSSEYKDIRDMLVSEHDLSRLAKDRISAASLYRDTRKSPAVAKDEKPEDSKGSTGTLLKFAGGVAVIGLIAAVVYKMRD